MRFICALVLILGLALPAEAMEGVNMKRLATYAFTLGFALSVSSVAAYSQARDRRPPRQPGSDRRQTVNPTPANPTPRPIAQDPRPGRDPRPDRDTRRPARNDFEHNPQVAARVKSMLPAGMTIQEASSGFRSEGQFLATLHASKNLGIPFTSLKERMTGPNAMPLGQAIHELRPDITLPAAKQHADKAEQQSKLTQQATN